MGNLRIGVSQDFTPIAETPGVPTGYIKFLIYDKSYRFIESKVHTIITADNAWQRLDLRHIAAQEGYVQIIVSYESVKPVWFDDIAIRLTRALVVQENHYDPWGLNLAGIETQGQPDHKFQYNGKEKQSELGLDWNDFGWRNYDPQLGRWHNIDLLADKRHWMTPYNYVQNNPMNRFDPNGLTDFTMNKKTGEVKEVKYDDKEKQKANLESKTDRIVRTNSKGVIRTNRNGDARTAVGSIEKGILNNGQNFRTQDKLIQVGGEGQPSVEGVKSFTLKLSEYVGKEIRGFSYSSNASGNVTDMVYAVPRF